MTMSRKHYRAAAAALAAEYQVASPETSKAIENIARNLAVMFQQDNSEFSLAKFYEAALPAH